MVTLADDIVHLLRLRPEGMSDGELAQATGKVHQQINQRCRDLASQGLLARDVVGGVIRNRLLASVSVGQAPTVAEPDGGRDWFWEGNIQSAVCAWLVREGWSLVRVADTATKERGTDIEATRNSARLHAEVKGYPSAKYADARRATEVKRTQPSLQAKHWYADALLKVVRLRDKHPLDEVAMAFPDIPRYRSLIQEIERSLRALRIGAFVVEQTGSVSPLVWDGG